MRRANALRALAMLLVLLLSSSACRTIPRLPSTQDACEEAGFIWDAHQGVCRDDSANPRAINRYGVPDRPERRPESN